MKGEKLRRLGTGLAPLAAAPAEGKGRELSARPEKGRKR